jgi:hypothetical protein
MKFDVRDYTKGCQGNLISLILVLTGQEAWWVHETVGHSGYEEKKILLPLVIEPGRSLYCLNYPRPKRNALLFIIIIIIIKVLLCFICAVCVIGHLATDAAR